MFAIPSEGHGASKSKPNHSRARRYTSKLLAVAMLSTTAAVAIAAPVTAQTAPLVTGDGGFTLTESVGANEPADTSAIDVLFPGVTSAGLPDHPVGTNVVSCLGGGSAGIFILQENTTNPNFCGLQQDSRNGNGIADRSIAEGYILIPPFATSVTFQASNYDPVQNSWRAGAVHLYGAESDDPADLVYLGGQGVLNGSVSNSDGTPAKPEEVNEIEFTMNFPGGASGCVSLPAATYALYVFDGHAKMSASIAWSVTGGPEDTGGTFEVIPTQYLSSLAGYDNDPNGNGTPDWQEADTDGDGITDYEEGELGGYPDTDMDGAPDCNDAPDTFPDVSSGNTIGDDVVIDVLGSDPIGNPLLDPTTVMILDANGDPVTELVVPGEGTWTVDSDTGAITFSPEPGFEGDPTPIDYTVMDVAGATSPATSVTVDYIPTVEGDESLGNPAGSTVTVDVLASDGDIDPTTVAIDDPNYDPSTGTLVVPGEGTWTVDPDTGVISFVPELGFDGDPTPIAYTASDDDGNEVTAELTITYAPVLGDDESLGNAPGAQVAVSLIGNDSADIDPATIAFIDPATGLALNAGQNLVVAGEGTWMVNQTTGVAFFTPEAGFEGDPTPVEYQAADTAGVLGEPATITVDYIPTAEDDELLGNTPGTAVVVDVLANDGDIDPTTVMILDADGNPVTSLVVDGEGTWTVDPDTGAITFTPESGFVGNPTPIEYSAMDNDGNEVTAAVVVGYTPVAAPDESLGNEIGSAVTIDVLGNDPALNLDPTTVMILDADGNPVTSLVVDGEGTWSVDPDTGAITFTPEAGFEGDPTPITYTVMDDLGQTTPPVEVIVDYVPGAVDDELLGNTPGTAVVVDVLANDGDIDPTTVMILDADGNPVTSLVVDGEGTWTVDPDTGAITFTPESGFVGNPTPIEYSAMDNDGNEVTAAVVVGYTPEGAPDQSLDNIPGTAVTIDVLGNDPALNLDPTTVMVLDPATALPVTSLTVPGEGVWDVDPVTGGITFTPEPGFVDNPTPITYTVADDLGQTIPPVEVIVDYLPVPPAAPDESLGNVAGSTVTIDVLVNDGSIDPTTVTILDTSGNPVTSLTVPGEGVWSIDPVTGEISFAPEAGFEGNPTPIEYVAVDVLGVAISPQTVTITYLDAVVPTLAFTGVESRDLAMLAFLLLAAGGLMTQSTTRRREEDQVNI